VDAGIATVTIETGAPIELQPSAVAGGVRGIRALLSDLVMDNRVRLWGNPESVYYGSTWVRAGRGGISLTRVRLGQRVRAGEVLTAITDPITNISSDVLAPRDGRILGMALNQIVIPGFGLFRLGFESADPLQIPPEFADEPEDES
jgi:predicted deacylase